MSHWIPKSHPAYKQTPIAAPAASSAAPRDSSTVCKFHHIAAEIHAAVINRPQKLPQRIISHNIPAYRITRAALLAREVTNATAPQTAYTSPYSWSLPLSPPDTPSAVSDIIPTPLTMSRDHKMHHLPRLSIVLSDTDD